MSGGYFEYKQSSLLELKELMEEVIGNKSGEVSEFSLKAIKDLASDLDEMYHVLRALDWWLDGDSAECKFIEKYNIFRSRRGKVNMEE